MHLHMSGTAWETSGDEALMHQVAYGDEHALLVLYERHYQRVYTVAYQIMLDRLSAEEVAQDVFLGVWRSATTFQVDGVFIAWVIGITQHRAIDLLRSRRYRARAYELPLDALEDMPHTGITEETQLDTSLLRTMIDSTLNTLPPLQREVIQLAYLNGMTLAQVAAHLHEPVGTVKWRLHTSLGKLRATLSTADREPQFMEFASP